MSAHLNLDLDYFGHRKTKRLVGLLSRGSDVLPLRLWCYCGKYHSADGRLAGYSVQEIESIVEWWGKPGEAVKAMLTVKFLDREPDGTYVVHGWLEMQGHIEALRVRNKAAAESRWAKMREACVTDTTGMPGQCPIPTIPSIPNKEPPAPFRQFTDYFCEQWKSVNGGTYPFNRSQGAIAAAVWKSLGEDLPLAKRVVDAYFTESSDFYAGHKLGKLQSDLARFVAKANKGKPGRKGVMGDSPSLTVRV